jgi:hypothetical protein
MGIDIKREDQLTGELPTRLKLRSRLGIATVLEFDTHLTRTIHSVVAVVVREIRSVRRECSIIGGKTMRCLFVTGLIAVSFAVLGPSRSNSGFQDPAFGLPLPNPPAMIGAEPGKPASQSKAGKQESPVFDSAKAFEHLRQMVAIGPRPAGSPALRQTRTYITNALASIGLTVHEQRFTAQTPIGPIVMVNLTVALPGRRTDRILLTGHYDTKLSRDFPFVGASDAASSAAILIELARVLKDKPREFTYEFVWFDGEEATCWDWDECSKPGAPDNTYGSRYYVDAARKAGTLATIKTMILFDMIGAHELKVKRDAYSARWLNELTWAAAKKLGDDTAFLDVDAGRIEDDHLAFVEAGVPSIDLIDLNDYPQWHTAQDDLNHVSARSLQIVGDVILAALPDIERHLMR